MLTSRRPFLPTRRRSLRGGALANILLQCVQGQTNARPIARARHVNTLLNLLGKVGTSSAGGHHGRCCIAFCRRCTTPSGRSRWSRWPGGSRPTATTDRHAGISHDLVGHVGRAAPPGFCLPRTVGAGPSAAPAGAAAGADTAATGTGRRRTRRVTADACARAPAGTAGLVRIELDGDGTHDLELPLPLLPPFFLALEVVHGWLRVVANEINTTSGKNTAKGQSLSSCQSGPYLSITRKESEAALRYLGGGPTRESSQGSCNPKVEHRLCLRIDTKIPNGPTKNPNRLVRLYSCLLHKYHSIHSFSLTAVAGRRSRPSISWRA